MSGPVLVWLRQDLRLADQAALVAAAREGPVVPVYVLDDELPGAFAIGAAQRWWLHHSLAALDRSLRARGSRLILRRGRSEVELTKIAAQIGARRVHALAHAEPWWRAAEASLAAQLDLTLHDGGYLAPLGSVKTGSGQGFKIYTPFWRALQHALPPPQPSPAPQQLAAPERWPASDRLADWHLLPTRPNWANGFAPEWQPGEAGAHAALDDFVAHAAAYAEQRNLPAEQGSSRLSPHLHFGEISPSTVWHRVAEAGGSVATYLGELGWRDFTANLTLDHPELGTRNARPGFDRMPWRTGPDARADLASWQHGRTGYPIVDAGMRQLWATGWMHNRARMIAASFLVKHLLIDWRHGERWFWDTLVDADYANNAVNWQWIAGSGVDASLWSRMMAPLVQSVKFAGAGYIRRWVPELGDLPDDAIHDPDAAGLRPAAYPAKIIAHREARERALAAGRAIR